MNKFFRALDKYKYGIIAAMLTYLGIFVYTNLVSYKQTFVIEGWFDEKAEIIEDQPEQIELKPENIEIPSQSGEVKNLVTDANDQRKKSTKEYYESDEFARNPEEAIKKLEEQYRQEAGGDQKRAEIKEATDQAKKKLDQKKNNAGKQSTSNQKGGDTQFSGNTMVKFSLSNRTAFENNKWYIRNPGYTCGQGASGTATVRITVDKGGRVIDAILAPELSNTNNPCILEQAKKYALMSRFNPSSNAPDRQFGTIIYTFEAQ